MPSKRPRLFPTPLSPLRSDRDSTPAVAANGTAFWSRPGELNSMCNLNGLNDFPFDQIVCSLKFGGWSLGGSVQNISYYTDQPINLIQARSATYQETLMVGGSVERGVGHFDCCPDRYGWPYVEFTLIFGRAEKQYDIKIIMMNIALTYLSFAVFLLDPKTGERLQFSVTLLLTIVAADSFVQGVVPVCTPLLWIEWFFMICWFFNVLTIMANTYSHYLYYKAPPEVYASGMPRLATKMEAAYRRFWRQQSDAVSKSSASISTAPPRLQRSMWRSSTMIAPVSPVLAPSPARGDSYSNPSSRHNSLVEASDSRLGSPSASLRRLRAERSCARLHRLHSNPSLEPNSPGRMRLGRQRTQRLSGPGVRMRPPSMAAYAAAAMAPARASSVAPAPAPALSTVHSGDDPTVVRDAASPAPEDSLPARAAGAVKFAAEPSCKPTLTVESAESSPAAERPSGAVAADTSEDASQGASSSTRQVPPRWRRLQRMSLFLQGRSGRFGGSGSDRSSSRESERDDAPWSSRQRRYRGTDVHAHRHFEGAFVEAEDLAEAVTATELDPVQAALVRKAFRLLDSMSSMVGEIGPSQMEYFAHHFGRLPKELQETDENQDGLWSIGEFSQLCLRLIKIYGDEKFRVLVEGLLESYAHKMKLHRVYWEGWALWMDYISLFTLPTLYTIALAVLFSWVHRMPPPPGNEHVILSAMQ